MTSWQPLDKLGHWHGSSASSTALWVTSVKNFKIAHITRVTYLCLLLDVIRQRRGVYSSQAATGFQHLLIHLML